MDLLGTIMAILGVGIAIVGIVLTVLGTRRQEAALNNLNLNDSLDAFNELNRKMGWVVRFIILITGITILGVGTTTVGLWRLTENIVNLKSELKVQISKDIADLKDGLKE